MNLIFKKCLSILAAAVFFIILQLSLNNAAATDGIILDSGWRAGFGDNSIEIEMPYRYMVKNPELWSYSTVFKNPKLDSPCLVITRPLSFALEVKLNGQTIWRAADLEKPTGNLWNHSFIVPLEYGLEENNSIEIISAPLHVTGFSVEPYLTEYTQALKKNQWLNFLLDDVLQFSIGGSICLGIILIILSISRKKGFDAAFFMGVASITAAIYCIDYHFMIFSGSVMQFLQLKKLFLFCGYLSAGSFLVSVNKFSDTPIKNIRPVIILTLIACAGIASTWSFTVLFNVFRFSNVLLMVNLLIGNFILLRMSNLHSSFLIPLVLLTLSIGQVLLFSSLGIEGPLTLQYILLISTLFFSIYLLLDFNSMFRENKKLAIGINQDPLTGIFNRHYLKRMNPLNWDCIAMTDLDNFKYYNDTYGHGSGDKILKLYVQIVKENLRSNDLVMRYGGDEFLIFLSEVDSQQSQKIMQRISQQFSDKIDDKRVGISYGLIVPGRDIDEAIAEADKLMYEMKRAQKSLTAAQI
ncbi:MAG: diguanylate cyclase [Spirochaetales bacterium]|nr:diguanylate cyclase [Spirochaetales bacterium]